MPPAWRGDTEQGLLGAILNNNDAMDIALQIVNADDFEEDIHRAIFAAMTEKRNNRERIDVKLLTSVLGDFDLGGVAMGEYIARLAHSAVTVSSCRDYAKEILRGSQLRQIHTMLLGCMPMVASPDASPVRLAGEIISALDPIASSNLNETQKTVTLREAADSVIDNITLTRQGKGVVGLPYALRDLDRFTRGMMPAEIITLAGRPGMGKTTVGMHIALQTAMSGRGVFFVSLEMSAQLLAERALAALTFRNQSDYVSYLNIGDAARLDDYAFQRVIDARDTFRSLPFRIDQQGGLTMPQISARARQAASYFERQNKPMGLIVIDHLHLINAVRRGNSENRTNELSVIMGGVRVLAKETGCPVLLLSQLSRQVESRENKRPLLSDLRESGSIEQDSDVVLGLFREEYYLRAAADTCEKAQARLFDVENTIEIEVLKQRQGPTGTARLFCCVGANFIGDLA